ncbi:MAG: transglutaminase domain-containing protein [Rhizobiales bacterium]|nr:transglutaminase domain-containing protein [Hyphomicrobiales bacterium]
MKKTITLLLLLPLPALAAPDCSIPEDHVLLGQTSWYGVYFDSRKIGHGSTGYERTTMEGVPVITYDFTFQAQVEKTENGMIEQLVFEAEPPHRLLGGFHVSDDFEVTYWFDGDDVQIEQGGAVRTWQDVDYDLCDTEDLVMFQLLQRDPEIGSRVESKVFDVNAQMVTTSTHEVSDVGQRTIMGARHSIHTVTSTYAAQDQAMKASTTHQNGLAMNFFMGSFELRRETEAIALEPGESIDLFAEFLKPLDRPLTELETIESLTLKASIGPSAVTIDEVLSDRFMQRVEILDARSALVTIADAEAPEGEQPPASYLRSTGIYPADHPRIGALLGEALQPLGGDQDQRRIAEALVGFVKGFIRTVPQSPFDYHTDSVFDILDNRTGDCTEHSLLYVTLARAAGIPAREVHGFVYAVENDRPSLAGHQWVEVFLDGRWAGMDPTWEETELNKSHVQVPLAWSVPSLSFDIVDIRHR